MHNAQYIIELTAKFRQLGIDEQIDFKKFYLYSIITHSTAIEGSTVTEIENQLLFDQNISADGRSMTEQLMNIDLKGAYDQSYIFARNHTDLSVDLLKKLSALVMKNTGGLYKTALGEFSAAAGDLRLLNVMAGVGGRSYMNYSKVPTKLAEFCDSINSRRHSMTRNDIIDIYRLSFYAHYVLATIHPWADGNGRMSRLLMNQIQVEFGVMPTIIHKQNKAQYIEALSLAQQSDDFEIFHTFMIDDHCKNLQNIIDQYNRSMTD